MSDAAAPVLLTHDGAVSTITINRPGALNALNRAALEALQSSVDLLRGRAETGVVIVTGAGDKAFVAGADIAEMRDLSQEEAKAFAELGQGAFAALEALPVPVIAAVNGFALGGGCELALACDFIHASSHAKFGPEEALRIGLINAIHPRAELLAKVSELANSLLAVGKGALAAAKRVMNEGADLPLAAAIAAEARALGACFGSEQREGMGAFLEKRPPRFR
jgi:enoyl-CoA hydratase